VISSDLLDVVIGVVFAWLILSLIISFVGEGITWAFKTRAKLLWRSLSQLFDAEVGPANGRVKTMYARRTATDGDRRPRSEAETEPIVPVGTVAATVDSADATRARVKELYDVVRRRVPDPAPMGRRSRITKVPGPVVADAFHSQLLDRPGASPQEREAPPTIADIERVLAKNPWLRERIRSVTAGLQGDEFAQRVREEVERWFDGAMDGLSAFYRRQNRKILAIVAVPVVLMANAGAFSLFHRLQDDQDLRTASATAAAQWAAEPLTSSGGSIDLAEVCERITEAAATPTTTAGSTTTSTPTTTTAPAPTTTLDPIAESRRRFNCAGELFRSTDLLAPIGPKALYDEFRDAGGGFFDDLWSWTWHDLTGRIVTWVALLFGASFWYDALRRLIGLKGKASG
jgi:hypothetical protein